MAIFGGILYLPFKSGTIVFVAVLVVFTIFEGLLHILEVECNKHGLKGLIKKMYREFMILGFISFAILLATELTNFQTNIWYDAFHFAHIVILFVGFVFLLQSGLLSALVRYRNRALLSHDNSSSEELIIEYVNLHNKGGIMKYLFDFGPVSIPIPELREKIEYKIIQEFFVRNYNLPPEFKFANYMCGVLRHYVISLVEVRPISWVILACFVCLNLFRIEVIDHIYARSVCERYPAKNLHISSSHRFMTQLFAGTDDVDHAADTAADLAYGKHVCQEYLLRYTFVLLFFIMFYVVGVLVASEIYIQRLIGKVLDQEETIEWLEDEEQRNQQMALYSDLQQQEPPQEHDAYVDISHLPDDTHFEGSNPQRRLSAGSKDSAEAKFDVGEGIEMSKLPLPHRVSNDSVEVKATVPSSPASAPAVLPSAPIAINTLPPPRRMSAAFRQASGRVRTGSAADIPDELVDHLPPVPVYGAANVRRLSMLHRRNSAKGDDLAAMLASVDQNDLHGATSPRRLSGNYKEAPRPPLSLDLPSNTHAPVHRLTSAHRMGSAPAGTGAGIADQDALAAAGGNSPMRRRLASHHRMGSLRSEISQIEAESGVPGGPRRRMHAGYRQGSASSVMSEKLSSKNTDTKGAKLLSAHNRRFLYLRCLERIMHVEFDFHANEAKRLGQQEQTSPTTTAPTTAALGTYSALSPSSDHHGPGSSSKRIARANTIHNLNQSSMRDLLHSPGVSERRDRSNTRALGRNNSVGSIEGRQSPVNGGANPDLDLLHTDMRSNFRLMKDLRKEMLEEEKNYQLAQSPVPDARQHGQDHTGGGFHFPKLFGGHQYHAPVPSIPPPERRIVSTFSMDEELGGLAVQEMHELELAHGLDYESAELKSNGKPRRKRDRTFSLTFESPANMTASQKSYAERRYEHMSYTGKLCHNLGVYLHHVYEHSKNMLMGHHIGQEEIKPDADIADLQEDFTHIFLFRSAELYYFCVEFSLLAQCVYLAIWATNLIFIANDSYFPVLWNIALLVPVPINFLITKQIIFTSVMLKSIVTLDKYVADKICEEAVDERNVKQRVRKVIRTALRTLEIPRENWLQFTMDQFDLYIPDNDVGLNLSNLKLFLHSMQIFLTDATTKRIFTVLDFDKDDRILWDEMMPIVFPELVRKQVKLNRQRNKGKGSASRRATMSFDYQIEGDLVTAEQKKEVQRRTRKQKRASMVTNDGLDLGGAGSGTESKHRKNGSKSHKKKEKKRGSKSGDERSSEGSAHKKIDQNGTIALPPDTSDVDKASPTPLKTPHTVASDSSDDLRSDDSDHGDESSESSFNSHELSSSESSDDSISHINDSTDIDVVLAERSSRSHGGHSHHSSRHNTRTNSMYSHQSHRSNRSNTRTTSTELRGSESTEHEKSVRFSKFFDV